MTLSVLASIRDEIRSPRQDTNQRFERIERDISQINKGIDKMVPRFERHKPLLASEVDTTQKRPGTCEERLGIISN